MRPSRLWPSFETPRFARLLRMRTEFAAGMRHRPYSLRRGVRRSLVFSPRRQDAEGTARRSAQPVVSTHLLIEGVAPCGAPSRRSYSGIGPRFAHGALRAIFRYDLTAPFGSTVPSQPRTLLGVRRQPCSWQAPVVGPGGAPMPPECEVTSLARGRRAAVPFGSGPECADGCSPPPSASRLLHHRDVSRRRPQLSKAREYNPIIVAVI